MKKNTQVTIGIVLVVVYVVLLVAAITKKPKAQRVTATQAREMQYYRDSLQAEYYKQQINGTNSTGN